MNGKGVVKMNDNVMNLIERLVHAEAEKARLTLMLSVLQRIVDCEEYEATKRQIEIGECLKEPAYTAISISEIRKVFGWGYGFSATNLISQSKKMEEES